MVDAENRKKQARQDMKKAQANEAAAAGAERKAHL